MFYPLSSVHKLIYETIHPETISLNQTPDSSANIWKHLKQEIEASRLHLFSQLNQASGTDCLKVIVYTCQAGYVSLINRLHSYINQPAFHFIGNGTEPTPEIQYREIRRILIAHLNQLYQYYAPFFDSEQTVPRFVVNSHQNKIKSQLSHVRKQLVPLCPDPSLLSIVDISITQIAEPKPPNLTYQQFYYIHLLLRELNTFCLTTPPSAEVSAFTDFLIRVNFNEPKFTDYLIQQLREQIPDDMDLPQQAEKWAFHVKEFNQLATVTSYSLYPHRKPVKECLIHAAEQELFFVKQKILFLPSTHAAPLSPQKERNPVVTHLTVSQLGVFTRLLVDCKVIEHPNQTELLKLIAGCLTTTRTAQISAESLRVRYYNPDRASIAIAKAYLLQMLKQLNTY